jgi:hypothetical protein
VEKNKRAFGRRALKSIASHVAGRKKQKHLKMLLLKEEGRKCVHARRRKKRKRAKRRGRRNTFVVAVGMDATE